ncbi:39S ribosomal protein L3, mitochondrial [Ixodes scapularis]|uniref:Large ribosomal subunit protein uL3m n=1 Tax=Ixodes scapularis TaxID=6945 RepID=B7QEI9_IXOSC|nr:39S ribosomal protein L3, mitochondrial [Ixodes scapularis]EEC17261.1 60S ribosomal protein L3, putative [Ixodes scapularis]|eukprot:XP_002413953.1 60S ribosomal protein L3, putative [Ixodes scapularis]
MALCATLFSQVRLLGGFINTNTSRFTPCISVACNVQCRYKTTTPKRRKTYPFHWWAPRKRKHFGEDHLLKENIEFLKEVAQKMYLQPGESPLRNEPWEKGVWTPDSVRTGVIARKIGIYPMWTTSGKRILTTLLQVLDNHVIRYIPSEEYASSRFGFKAKGRGCLVVGAGSADPMLFKAPYLRLFQESGVMPKRKLTRFLITDDAAIQPGTPLSAGHFRAGDYVNVYGKTRGHGFQGVMKRWKMKGGPKSHGTTKAHRRLGAIGGPRGIILKGKRMPGHMGQERRLLVGLKIWRINTKLNVLFVQGPAVPGATLSYVNIYDSRHGKKKHTEDNPPPFPTYYPDPENPLPEEMYDKELHQFEAPSVTFVDEEVVDKKKAKVKAKAKAKGRR